MSDERKMLEQIHTWIFAANNATNDSIEDFKGIVCSNNRSFHKKLGHILDKNQYTINSLSTQLESKKVNEEKTLSILNKVLFVNTKLVTLMEALGKKVDVIYDQKTEVESTPKVLAEELTEDEKLPTLKDMTDAADKTLNAVVVDAIEEKNDA
jgi:hypothetical protein